jgi:hypothetical protein
MVWRWISEAQRWQIIGMHKTGMSFTAIGCQMGYHHTVVSRLVRKRTQTNNVKDLPRSGRPRVTSDRDDMTLQRLVRRMPFATSPVLKQHWLPNRHLSTRRIRNRLKSAGLKSRRVIKRPLLADWHRRITFGMVFSMTWLEFKDMAQDPLVRRELVSASCNRRPDEGLETQKYNLYPKEHPTNCPLRWSLSNGLGVYLSWLQAGFSHHTRQPNWWWVHQRRLATSRCPPFRQPPTSYKACVYGWQHQTSCSRAVTAYLQSKAVTSVPWPVMSPDLNPIEHIWDMLGRRIHAREPPVQNIRQLEAAITTGHPTCNWRDETQGWGRHPSTWG